MDLRIARLSAARMDDFARVHCHANQAEWCQCVAWWVPTWDGWGGRDAGDNRALRRNLCERGEYDGYLLYADRRPVGWCQAGARDRLTKLTTQLELAPDSNTWALTCFLIAPTHRGRGLARYMLGAVLDDLRDRGVRRVEAFPKRGADLDVLDLWNGPEAMFLDAGFVVVKPDMTRPVLALSLDHQPGAAG